MTRRASFFATLCGLMSGPLFSAELDGEQRGTAPHSLSSLSAVTIRCDVYWLPTASRLCGGREPVIIRNSREIRLFTAARTYLLVDTALVTHIGAWSSTFSAHV